MDLCVDDGMFDDKSDVEGTDCDLIPFDELKKQFLFKSEVMLHKHVDSNGQKSQNKYILHIDGTLNSDDENVAISTSDNFIEVYNLRNGLSKVWGSNKLKRDIIGLKFVEEDPNLLFVGTNKDFILMYDLRLSSNKPSSEFKDVQEGLREALSFDISHNKMLLCAGTELTSDGDAFILFWDVRNAIKPLGAYWESHTEDITSLSFHPKDTNKLISASTDGLINLYDLKENCEDDALTESLNTESSISKIHWHIKQGGINQEEDFISCLTHTEDFQLWQFDKVEPLTSFKRQEIAKNIRRKNANFVYPINSHSYEGGIFLLAGSQPSQSSSGCVRALNLNSSPRSPKKTKKIEFEMENNNLLFNLELFEKNDIVRSSWFDDRNNLLITGGESGVLSLYKICQLS